MIFSDACSLNFVVYKISFALLHNAAHSVTFYVTKFGLFEVVQTEFKIRLLHS